MLVRHRQRERLELAQTGRTDMAGILDFLQSPDAQLGIGLLAAGGPTTDINQTGFGQRLAAGMQYADAQKAQDLKLQLLKSQVAENASQDALRQAQLARQTRMDNYYLGSGFGGSAAPAPQGTAAGAPEGAVLKASLGVPADSPRPPQGKFAEWSAQYKIPVDALVSDYVSNGGKGIAEMLMKRGTPDMQVSNNYAYDKNKIGTGFLPGLNIAQDGKASISLPGPDGLPVVSAPQGAVDTFRSYQGAQGSVKPIKVWDPAQQREVYTNETAAATGNGPGARAVDPLTAAVRQTESNGNVNAVSSKGAQGDMQVMPGTNMSPGFGVVPARDGSQAERTRVGEEYLKAMNDRYKNPTLAAIAYNWGPGNADMWLKSGGDYDKLPDETKKYVSAVMTRTAVNGFGGAQGGGNQPQSGNMAAGPSTQEQASAEFNKTMAGKQAEQLDKSYTAANDASSALLGIQQSRKAMNTGAFQGSGAEAKLAITKFINANIPGVNIMPEDVANTDYLKSTLGGALLEKAKTLGSNPSNADASRITDIVGSIGKDPNAMGKILDWQQEMAMRSITQHNTKIDQAASAMDSKPSSTCM
jgi:hypothetical protein